MSVRQYIGARYVPRFSDVNGGVWSNIYSYEPLTIVKNGNDYHTSKQAVPVGIDITNKAYWVQTGNYNGAITELQNEINDLDGRSDILETKVAALEFQGSRRFVFMGDSYDDIGDGWIAPACSILGITNYVDISYYGEGFTTSHSWKDRLNEAVISNPDTVTDLVVCGGANDRAQVNNIVAAMAEFKAAAYTKFPNLRNIHIGAIGFRCNTTTYIGQSSQVASRYKEGCNINGMRYLKNTDYLLMYPSFWALTGDTNHPQAVGVQFAARGIAQAILTGSCDVQYVFSETIPFVSASWFTSNGSGIRYDTSFHNGIVDVKITIPTISVVEGAVSEKAIAVNNSHFNIYAFPSEPTELVYGFMGNDIWLPMHLSSASDMVTVNCYTLMNKTGTVIPQTFKTMYNLQADLF